MKSSAFEKYDNEENLRLRMEMVEKQIRARGIYDTRVLKAMETIPRHFFVPQQYLKESYDDHPLPIGNGQTISQPYIVALMSELIRSHSNMKILEIGTGCGYQTAVLSRLVEEVYSIEIVEDLYHRAKARFENLNLNHVHIKLGDGSFGWPEAAPFDAILGAASPKKIPDLLLKQLKVGGRLVMPEGDISQYIMVITRTEDGFIKEQNIPVRFVSMTGSAGE